MTTIAQRDVKPENIATIVAGMAHEHSTGTGHRVVHGKRTAWCDDCEWESIVLDRTPPSAPRPPPPNRHERRAAAARARR